MWGVQRENDDTRNWENAHTVEGLAHDFTSTVFCGFLPLSATRRVTTGRQCNNGIQWSILYTVLLNILFFKFVQLKCVTWRSRLGRREEHSRSRTHTDKTSHAHARTAERQQQQSWTRAHAHTRDTNARHWSQLLGGRSRCGGVVRYSVITDKVRW